MRYYDIIIKKVKQLFNYKKPGEKMLEKFILKDICFKIGDEMILNNINLTIKPGSIVGIIGPNGAGKTTLLRIILGVLQHQCGEIIMESKNSKVVMGYVPQSRNFDEETPLATYDFVSLGLKPRFIPWLTKQEKLRVKQVMEWTDCYRFYNKSIGKLSGGEKQRAYLAQALVQQPDLLILDEFTSNLDPEAQYSMMKLVKDIAETHNITVLCVSHDIMMVDKFTDHLLYLTRKQYKYGETSVMLSSCQKNNFEICNHISEEGHTHVST